MADELRMLAPESFREKLSRRAFIRAGSATAGLAVVAAACGNSKSSGGGGNTSPANGSVTWKEWDATATGDWSRKYNDAGGTLAMYTWGDYNDPEIVGKLAESSVGVVMKVDFYASNEDLITKLSTSNGNSGFDVIAPTGPYIPQMIQKGLIQKFDKSLLPNMVNVDPNYLGQPWDPTNEYSVCKDWGTTGFIYDTTKIKRDLKNWADFLDACMKEGSGNCSMLDSAVNYAGPFFWRDNKSWNTQETADLDAAESFLVDDLAKHVKAFDSYPSTKIAEGSYSISMAWNGDARQTYYRIADAGGKPENWKWVLGGPKTELWMDNYCIPAGAPNAAGAHAWINWSLIPEISIKDLNYHGYHTGMKNMSQLISELAPDLDKGDMIFFTDAQVKTFETQVIDKSIDRLVDILGKAKAKAGA